MRVALLFLFVLVGCALAYPRTYNRRSFKTARLQQQQRQQLGFIRARRAPLHRAMVIHGFYRPTYRLAQRRNAEAEAAMAAFASGDTVSAGSYLGSGLAPNCALCDTQAIIPENIPENEFPVNQDEEVGQFDTPDLPAAEAPLGDIPATEVQEVQPSRPLKKKPAVVESDDDDDEDAFVPKKSPKAGPTYFPVYFGNSPLGRSGGGAPTGVTAIANSYSTGKGGVATSHATAYGSGPPSKKRKNAADDDDDD